MGQRAFRERDPDDTGKVSKIEWARVVQEVTQVSVPWVTLCDTFVKPGEQGTDEVLWQSCLELRGLPVDHRGVAAGLYTNLRNMEAVFHLLDSDGSGTVCVAELRHAVDVLNRATSAEGGGAQEITRAEVDAIAVAMDVDLDGVVNFNEFLEAMRIHGLT